MSDQINNFLILVASGTNAEPYIPEPDHYRCAYGNCKSLFTDAQKIFVKHWMRTMSPETA